jgi:hypothetical protein
MMKFILTTIVFLALAVSGLAQTRSVIVNTSGVVQSPTNFWSADVTNARSGLGLGTAATSPASAFQPSSLVLSNLSSSNGSELTNLTAANITGAIAISNGGSGATTAGGARTNLGLGSTNLVQFLQVDAQTIFVDEGGNGIQFNGEPVAAATRTNLGLGATNFVTFSSIAIGDGDLIFSNDSIYWGTNVRWSPEDQNFKGTIVIDDGALAFGGTNAASNIATTRTNLGLGWSALTNTSTSGFNASLYGSGTNPVLYNTNGEVVSPTNFWQVAPIVTRFVEFDPATNATTNIVAARNLHIHSLAISRTGVTSTIALPITNSFDGDVALVVHQGPTSSVTAVRTAGAATNLITLNQFEEAVEFVYYNSVWQFNHNRSFIEPIFFSGTNAVANAAASRTNLGLGWSALTNTNINLFKSEIELGEGDIVTFAELILRAGTNSSDIHFAVDPAEMGLGVPIAFGFTNQTLNAAISRTNLGLGLPALTNTNNANFQAAIFNTNSIPTNGANVNAVNFNTAIHWMEVNVVTNGVTNNFRIPLFK